MKLFTKTWHQDLIWLKWAFRSVYKFCDEPIVWYVVAENNICDEIKRIAEECDKSSNSSYAHKIIVHGLDAWPEEATIKDKWLAQQWIKMTAHRIIGSDLVWNWDSDVFAQKHFTEADFLGKNNLPIYWFSDLDRLRGDKFYHILRQRADLIERLFGNISVSREWMRCMPIPLIGTILKSGEQTQIWGKCYKECAANNKTFSEFNVVGQFANLNFIDEFDWRDANVSGPTWAGSFGNQSIVVQNFSWGGETTEVKNWIQREFGENNG